jgi:MoaA/NifB/PqqE/SkfB family radical SAM enzyme
MRSVATRAAIAAIIRSRQSWQMARLRLRQSFSEESRYPRVFGLYLTTRCNLHCYVCPRDGYKGVDFDARNLPMFEKPIRYADMVNITGWGELTIYPQLRQVIDYIYSLNKKPNLLEIASNGTRLTPELARVLTGRISRFIISLNAGTPETYNRDMRGGNFTDTIRNSETFLSALSDEDRRRVQVHFVAHAGNYRELPAFVRLVARLGAPTATVGHYLAHTIERFKTASLYSVKGSYNLVYDEARAIGYDLGVTVTGRRFDTETRGTLAPCIAPLTEAWVHVSGEVAPCCWSGDYRTGNAYEHGFDAVWFGSAYEHLRNNRCLNICDGCTAITPLDDPACHFVAWFKETAEYQDWRLVRK